VSTPPAETHLVLIRHGESRAQVGGFASGHDTCTGLSDLGRLQAAALRDRLARTHELSVVDAVYTSLLTRAQETAAIVGSSLGGGTPHAECDWCEIHAGEAEGLTYQEIRDRFPADGGSEDALDRHIPGGETWAECYERVGRRLRRTANDHPGQRVVVVGHGGTIGASFVALGGVELRHSMALIHEARNTSLTEWRWTGTAWRLVRYNDAAHLADL
jgi:2,3-bisphosphoglycerate-dependent phosphoglycerate mutase